MSHPTQQHLAPYLQANEAYAASGQHQALALGVQKRLVVINCMDSRLIPENFLGLKLGDAEIIRNGGGRVTEDVIRSMIICQDLLHCDTVFIIHHTDCGGQNVLFCAQAVGEHVKHKAKEVLGLDTEGTDMKPILGLEASVRDDMAALRKDRRIKPSISIYGLIIDTSTGRLREVCSDVGASGGGEA